MNRFLIPLIVVLLPAGSAYSQSDQSRATPFLKDPYLIYTGTVSEMTVHWQMEDTQQCLIEWGTDTTYGMGSLLTDEYTSDHLHIHTITGLAPSVHYFYKVSCSGVEIAGDFYSAPWVAATDVSFIVHGDTRTSYWNTDSVAAVMVDQYTANPALQSIVLHDGDIIEFGAEENAWQTEYFNDSQTNLRQRMREVPTVACLGNHELYMQDYSGIDLDTPLFGKYLPYPYVDRRYWSFDYGPVHFVIADQYPEFYDPYGPGLLWTEQLTWMESDLAGTSKPWKIVLLHEPGWSCGGGHGNNEDVQQLLQPLCEEYGVQFVFAGHNHYYTRACVNGVHHITTGGGGAPLKYPQPGWPNVIHARRSYHFCTLEISGDQLSMSAINWAGAVIDSFSIDLNTSVNYLLGEVEIMSGPGLVEEVLVEADGSSCNPDTIGYYGMMLDPGVYDVTASLTGYETVVFEDVEIFEGTETTLSIELYPLSIEGSAGMSNTSLGAPVPNPFSSSTCICFDLSTSGAVHLDVYDLSGRLIEELWDGFAAAGEHSVSVDGSQWNPGVYLVILRSTDSTSVRKCLLIE